MVDRKFLNERSRSCNYFKSIAPQPTAFFLSFFFFVQANDSFPMLLVVVLSEALRTCMKLVAAH